MKDLDDLDLGWEKSEKPNNEIAEASPTLPKIKHKSQTQERKKKMANNTSKLEESISTGITRAVKVSFEDAKALMGFWKTENFMFIGTRILCYSVITAIFYFMLSLFMGGFNGPTIKANNRIDGMASMTGYVLGNQTSALLTNTIAVVVNGEDSIENRSPQNASRTTQVSLQNFDNNERLLSLEQYEQMLQNNFMQR